jgi:hypothetical protein
MKARQSDLDIVRSNDGSESKLTVACISTFP